MLKIHVWWQMQYVAYVNNLHEVVDNFAINHRVNTIERRVF